MLIYIFLGFVGAAMGSFVGALVWRLKNKQNFISERSECEYCHHKLDWHDLIPVFSWLALKGRCRYCGKRIGIQALVLEIATAILFMLSFVLWPGEIVGVLQITSFILWLATLVTLVALFVYDLHYKLLLDVLIFPAIGIATLKLALDIIYTQNLNLAVNAVVGIAICAGFFGLLYFISKGKWIGFGDVKFGILMGLLLGMPGSLIALVGSYYVAAVIILPLMLFKRLSAKSQVPFGPFLIAATILSFFFTSEVANWYISFIMG